MDTAEARRSALGDFLRARRERLEPQALGLPGRRQRRTPGLRREEVAERAGIGVDWYVRLEQGRAVGPSPATVDALARALLLDVAEHAHLRLLARRSERRDFVREEVPAALHGVLACLAQPAYVTGRRWDVLAWNEAAEAVFAFGRLAEAQRNTLLCVLTDPRMRHLFGAGWEAEARRLVAQFRATHDFWAGDPAFVDLLDRLRAGCPEFTGWWEEHDIGKAMAGVKVIHHPTRGTLRFAHANFQSNDDPSLRLVIYTPA